MEWYNKIMCVSYGDLVPEVMSEYTLRKNITRENIKLARRGGGEGSCALIVYGSIPAKYRRRFVEKYGDEPAELLKKREMKDKIRIDALAREFFEAFEYDLNGVQTHLNGKLIDEYTANASVLNELIKDMDDRERLTKMLNNRKRDLWEDVYAGSADLRKAYGHTLPENQARLRDVMRKYRRDGYASLISGKIGNRNTLKITEEAGDLLIALKRSRYPVFTDCQIFDRFNEVEVPAHNAVVTDAKDVWKPLRSVKSLVGWMNQPEVQPRWWDAVYGELKAFQRYGRKHVTELPHMRDSLWYGDGTKLNLYYLDENGELSTTQVYEVMDAYSEALLGYCISKTEDYESQYNAFRMAVQVSGHRPYEIVTDNQGGSKTKKLQDFYGGISHIHRATAPNTPQAKSIESAFGRFQSEVLHQYFCFTGQNITATKKSSRPNLEFIAANRDRLYTLEELKVKYAEAREMWNGERAMLTTGLHLKASPPAPLHKERGGIPGGITRMEKYLQSKNEGTPEVTVQDMVEMFWVLTDRPSTFTSQGLEFEVKGEKHRYEVYSSPGFPDHAWRRRNTYRQFFVKYDPYDFTSVRLYWKDKSGELRFDRVAEPYMVIHRNIQEQEAGDAQFIRQEQEANMQDRIARHVEAKETEWRHGVAPEQNGLRTPDLKGLSREENEELQRQIERRVRKYSRNPLEVAQANKVISMTTFDELEGETEFNYRRTAGKL